MFTYLIIGLIMQLFIVIERAFRFPEVWEGWKHFWFWVGFLSTATINVIVWPVTIVAEAYNIYKNQ